VILETYPIVGFNYRMTDIQAAVGREQLKRLSGLVSERRALASGYARRLSSIPGLGVPIESAWTRTNWQSFAVRLPAAANQFSVMQRLLDGAVATRRGVMCSHREPAYTDASRPWALPHSEREDVGCRRRLFPGMGPLEQDGVRMALARAVGVRTDTTVGNVLTVG